MSWIVDIFAAIFGAIKGLMSKKKDEDPVSAAVGTLNKTGAVEADEARTAQASIDEGNQHAQDVAADRHEQLAAAHGLSERAHVLDATRGRPDTDVGTDS